MSVGNKDFMRKPVPTLTTGRPSVPKAKAMALSDFDRVQKTRVNFELEKEYHTKLKILAATRGTTIKEILREYVIMLLSK